MGVVLECLTDKEEAFIADQKVFFVGTAPLSKENHVNVSPKSPGTSVIVMDPHTVAYSDLTGSGAETAAHILENSRMTLMFCNLEAGPPKILRLYGTAKMILKEDVEPSLLKRFPTSVTSSFGFRAVFVLNIHRISTSCGYSLPVMTFDKYRHILEEFTQKQGSQGMTAYRIKKNSFSIDGLPSLSIQANKDITIAPKREKGYVYGEIEKDATNSNYWKLNKALKHFSRSDDFQTKAIGIALFFLGVVVGSNIQNRKASVS